MPGRHRRRTQATTDSSRARRRAADGSGQQVGDSRRQAAKAQGEGETGDHNA